MTGDQEEPVVKPNITFRDGKWICTDLCSADPAMGVGSTPERAYAFWYQNRYFRLWCGT